MAIYSGAEFVRALKKTPENFYVIHYSCQSLFDNNEALSPRITSIAVSHYATDQVVSFSTHSVAEELGIGREEVLRRFDEVEAKLLQDFYGFVRERRDKFWIHWNMRNLTYGFEHLEHRYRVLGGIDAAVIPVERRLNLNDMLADRYGGAYAKHPKLKSLMELNGGIHRHFLTGEEEVQAFRNCEFIRMHNSTLTKVGFLQSVLAKLVKGKLHTASRGFGVMLDRAFEQRGVKVAAAAGTAVSACVAVWQAWLWIMPV